MRNCWKSLEMFDFSLTEVYFLGFSWDIEEYVTVHTQTVKRPGWRPGPESQWPFQKNITKLHITKKTSQNLHILLFCFFPGPSQFEVV